MRVFALTLCYDGTRYRGWQKQGNTENTLQEKLERLLSRLLEQPIEVRGCGRTDAGVHARRQVCSFRADTDLSAAKLLEQIRRYLPEDVGALFLEEKDSRFHARLCCREKTYAYRIWISPLPNVFERDQLYFFSAPLDVQRMRRAAELLLGEHDFSSFTSDRRVRTGKKSGIRVLREIRFEEYPDAAGEPGELRLLFTGNGFLYNTVRILTGTLLETGTGERDPESIPSLFESREREQAGFTAPARGLTLWDARY